MIAPGQVVEVWYASPWHQFRHGDIGLTKQTRGGLGILLALLAVIAVICVLVPLGSMRGI